MRLRAKGRASARAVRATRAYVLVECVPGHVMSVLSMLRTISGVHEPVVIDGAYDIVVPVDGDDPSMSVMEVASLDGIVRAIPCYVGPPRLVALD